MARYYVQYAIWAVVVLIGAFGLKSLDAQTELSVWDFIYTAIVFFGVFMEGHTFNSYRRTKKEQAEHNREANQ